ncbi:MAG: BamA/TamA family outer membrane protein [Vicinamibacterales bacterium]
MFRRFAVVSLSFALAVPAAAQSTRAEAVATEQAKKVKALRPEGPNKAELFIIRVTKAIGRTPEGPYPWFGSIFPGGLMAAGVGYGRSLPRGSRVNFVGGVSAKLYKLLAADFAPRELVEGRLHTSFGVEWIDAGSVAFHGLGPNSSAQRATFGYQPTTVHGTARFRAHRWVTANGGYNFLHTVTDAGAGIAGRFTPAETPGLLEPLNFNVAQIGVTVDTRSSPGYSTRGAMLRGSWSTHRERDNKPFSFTTSEYEAGVLIPLVREQFGLMFRALATVSDPDDDSRVPIMFAPDVGSGTTVRGFPNRRFQDNGRLVLTGEYRWRPSRYLDMAIFLDAGQVAPDWKSFRREALETGWGIGARLHGPSFTVLRLEIARTRTGLNLVVAATPAF